MGDRIGVLVTTLHKGVFFGFILPENIENKAVLRMHRARNCIYWAASVGGFLGLASGGPNMECRVGKEAPQIILHDITSVTICTQEAIDAWTSM